MHDLVTQDLALRIGGSKTGLMNASLVSDLVLRSVHGYRSIDLPCFAE